MLYVLDSTVIIDFLRGRPAVQRVLALRSAGDQPATTAINVEEISRGVRANEVARARRLIDGLLVLSIDDVIAWRAGQWRGAFAQRGVTLSQADCLIAAVTLAHGATLATGNPKDFPMPQLAVQHWPVGG